jgi:tryptophan synthase alpha chain
VAPSTTDERLAKVTSECSGFIYAASLMGVTGARTSVSGNAKALVDRIRSTSDTSVAVGLGVSNREQASEVASYADGVIVGSAFIKLIQEHGAGRSGLKKIKQLAESLSKGVRSGR